jgi:hypothetical protein
MKDRTATAESLGPCRCGMGHRIQNAKFRPSEMPLNPC